MEPKAAQCDAEKVIAIIRQDQGTSPRRHSFKINGGITILYSLPAHLAFPKHLGGATHSYFGQ